jgi:hypothetical protein
VAFMAEIKPFSPVKLICGLIASQEEHFGRAKTDLMSLFGDIDLETAEFAFNLTEYYERQLGPGLKRKFLSFRLLIRPEELSGIKHRTNLLEEEIRKNFLEEHRIINIDPGYITASALIMATAKDFSHRIPLEKGIYAHLEFLFSKNGFKTLEWTYPDFRGNAYHEFFLAVRKLYLQQPK